MSRVVLVIAASTAVIGFLLAGCSGSSVSMPEWLSPRPSRPPLQTLQFQSQPPGANVRTAKGETCQTPCSLQVQPESQSVTFEKGGFVPQTVQVSVAKPAEHSLFANDPPPTLTPNPVEVALHHNRRVPKPPAQQSSGATLPVQQQ
jgi:hypothetical protein